MDLTCLAASAPAFPPRLLQIPDPPARLWVRGTVGVLSRTSIAIVGSRRASPASLDIARRLGQDLAAAGLVIVSGLARGCDAAAHRGALEAAGSTIAVLGSGADVIYPPEHAELADAIVRAGAIVSEFPPGMPPLPNNFRQRNRLISGLAHGVVVIEANEKSGSLITAGCALAQGREVMVVPGTVLAGRNRGGHQLIRDGAALVENAEDILAVLVAAVPPARGERERAAPSAGEAGAPLGAAGAEPPAAEGRAPRASDASAPSAGEAGAPLGDRERAEPFDDDPLLAVLDPVDPQDFDEIARRVALPPEAILTRLSRLELGGQVARRAGGRFVRCPGKVIT